MDDAGYPLEDGSLYRGEFDSNGKLAGFGTLVRPDGVTYTGCFLDGQCHGEGTLAFSNGTAYTAQWERGAEVPGTGALTWPDGLVFNPLQAAATSGEAGAAAPKGAAAAAEAAAAAGAPEPRAPGEEWGYLSSHDRRLWSEHKAGVRANLSPRRAPAAAQAGGAEAGGAAEAER